MRVLVAPDSFKGSLTAVEAAAAIARGVALACPGAEVRSLPLSDGGEGVVDALLRARGGVTHSVRVTGPLGAPVDASWAMLGDGETATIESASAIGLALVPPGRRTPLETTTAGVGELVAAALAAGARHIIVGLGGTATIDGGAGMAEKLGVVFDGAGAPLTGGRLGLLGAVDTSARDPRLAGIRLRALTDVDNPLTGAEGAARTYGPQKGATESDVAVLDEALLHLARLVGDPGVSPGDGAAGGLGYGLRVLLGGTLSSGIDFVLDECGFDESVEGCDLVLIGEGRLDAQTAHGKVVAGVSARCRARGVPVIALVGAIGADADVETLRERGLTAAFSLCSGPLSEKDAMARAPALLAALAGNVLRVHAAR